jgi:hypothetical protein
VLLRFYFRIALKLLYKKHHNAIDGTVKIIASIKETIKLSSCPENKSPEFAFNIIIAQVTNHNEIMDKAAAITIRKIL